MSHRPAQTMRRWTAPRTIDGHGGRDGQGIRHPELLELLREQPELTHPVAVRGRVPISYGFGMRSGRMHEGVDFTPGAGSPIQAIADGVVRVATNSGGAYGVSVIIDHKIDGQLVSSRYAHMQYGSLQVPSDSMSRSAPSSVARATPDARTGPTRTSRS